MTRREQLYAFVLVISALSLCIVSIAIATTVVRRSGASARATAQARAGRPTFTPRPTWTATATPTPTATATYTPTPTRTPVPTDTPSPTPTFTDTPRPTATATRPPLPTPTLEPPTATPTPSYPFLANPVSFNTGTAQFTRLTGMAWKVIDINTNQFVGDPGYQMRVLDPAGQEHLSDISGPGYADSTCPSCGDNRAMNMKVEFAPYVPGVYRIKLMRDGNQVSNEIEVTLADSPQQYVHVDFIPAR